MKRLVKQGTCPTHGIPYRDGRTCEACKDQHRSLRVGKTKLKRDDRPLPYNYDAGYTLTKRSDGTYAPGAVAEWLKRVAADPILAAQVELKARRPKGVSKERFGVAVRAAVREPMLNADPAAVQLALRDTSNGTGTRPAVGYPLTRFVVKPLSLRNAKGNQSSAFWGERVWTVFPLKYGTGYVVRTDRDEWSAPFKSPGELRRAIKDSGWDLVRSEVIK